MSAASGTEAAVEARSSPALACGAAVTYLGLGALVASAVWTVAPLAAQGRFEGPMIGLVGLVLVGAGAIGRRRFAGSTPGKLLCALGAGLCLRVAVDPTLESIPALGKALPSWAAPAYPGLATLGWVLAALGAAIWWLGSRAAGGASPYRGVTVVCGALLVGVTAGVGSALAAAGYEVPRADNGLLVWRLIEAMTVLMVAMSISGARGFAQWPLLLFGAGLVGHAVRTFVSHPPA